MCRLSEIGLCRLIKQELRSFLGFANYHREYIKSYSVIVEVLQQLVNNQNRVPFGWHSAIWMPLKIFAKSYVMRQFFRIPIQSTCLFLIVMQVP